ncbi:hypothetical protein T265_00851 [Opisthorchis viverrini]|uniref:Uncharacterized protein n=1 Tax=Opisthorchis viverrini TaxID=6198 RepID=A0A075A0E9_OPIVI|nr:hypothetical protein T265_00851 [Opisthorchis viverrini]KER33148.1 hypothetical protein T265_00851 [Opisthorchis viverrini]
MTKISVPNEVALINNNNNRSVVAPFLCLAATPTIGGMTAGTLPGCSSLDKSSRDAAVGFEPRTFRPETLREIQSHSQILFEGCQLGTEEAPIQLRTDDVSLTGDETFASQLPSSANGSTAIRSATSKHTRSTYISTH